MRLSSTTTATASSSSLFSYIIRFWGEGTTASSQPGSILCGGRGQERREEEDAWTWCCSPVQQERLDVGKLLHFLGSCLRPEQYRSTIFCNFWSPRDFMILVEHFIHCTPFLPCPGMKISHTIKERERRLWYFLAPAIYFLLRLRGTVEGAEEIARGNSPSFLLLSNNDARRTRNKGKGGEGGKLLLSAAPLTKSGGTTLRRPKKKKMLLQR